MFIHAQIAARTTKGRYEVKLQQKSKAIDFK